MTFASGNHSFINIKKLTIVRDLYSKLHVTSITSTPSTIARPKKGKARQRSSVMLPRKRGRFTGTILAPHLRREENISATTAHPRRHAGRAHHLRRPEKSRSQISQAIDPREAEAEDDSAKGTRLPPRRTRSFAPHHPLLR